MAHLQRLYVVHRHWLRWAWLGAMLVLAACNNGDGGGGDDGGGIY
jgi:hypothetical protein